MNHTNTNPHHNDTRIDQADNPHSPNKGKNISSTLTLKSLFPHLTFKHATKSKILPFI